MCVVLRARWLMVCFLVGMLSRRLRLIPRLYLLLPSPVAMMSMMVAVFEDADIDAGEDDNDCSCDGDAQDGGQDDGGGADGNDEGRRR